MSTESGARAFTGQAWKPQGASGAVVGTWRPRTRTFQAGLPLQIWVEILNVRRYRISSPSRITWRLGFNNIGIVGARNCQAGYLFPKKFGYSGLWDPILQAGLRHQFLVEFRKFSTYRNSLSSWRTWRLDFDNIVSWYEEKLAPKNGRKYFWWGIPEKLLAPTRCCAQTFHPLDDVMVERLR